MKGRNAQGTRIYKILSILEGAPHGLSAADLVSRLNERGYEVTKRTVYRDLEALRAAGFPLDEVGKSQDQGTRWTLERNARVNHYLVLTSRELFALYLSRSALQPLQDTPFFEDLNSTFQKITEKVGTKAQAFLEELGKEFRFEPGPRWGLGLDAEVVDTVRAACTERQVLEVTYDSVNSGGKTQRRLGAHFLYFARGSLYLVAEDLVAKAVKVFAVPRISNAKMLDEEYAGTPVDPEQYFENTFGVYQSAQRETIKIRFDAKVAAFVRERRWHSSQTIIGRDAGAIELQLEVGITPELVQWILGFGAHAQALAPSGLIEALVAETEQIKAVYRGKKSA